MTVYLKLIEFTKRVNLALKESDPVALSILCDELEMILLEYRDIRDMQKDDSFVEILQVLDHHISDVISKIRQCQTEISDHIKLISDGKKLVRAYIT